MIGASKILTVSYGTFSCTLEGFDEPFSTMKAIAEYFRDLAADDRYFGAEPPTPDAAMLHKIAEREIQRRVEAKINANGVVLRAEEMPTADVPVLAAAANLPPPVAASVVTGDTTATEAAPRADAPTEADSVAAKLMRIRSAVAQSQAPAARPAFAATEFHATDFAGADYVEDETPAVIPAAMDDPVAAEDALPEDLPLQPLDDSDLLAEDYTPEDLAPETEASPEDSPEDSPEVWADAAPDAFLPADVMSDAASPLTDDPADLAALDDDDLEMDADELAEWDNAFDDQPLPDLPEDLLDDGLMAVAQPGVPPAAAPVAAAPAAALPAADEPDLAAMDAETALLAALTMPQAPEPAPEPVVAEKAMRARARVIKIRRTEAAPAPLATSPAAANASLSPEAEADLARELAALEQDTPPAPAGPEPQAGVPVEPAPAPRPETELRKQIGAPAGDEAVSRLLEQTDSEMRVPENRRRLSALAHLKAAVAATVADRRAGAAPPPSDAARMDPYRSDLERAVRPRRPGATEADRPAPLVLVSEQRIDRQTAAAVAATRPERPSAPQAAPVQAAPAQPVAAPGYIRPRRVTSAALALAPEDDDSEDDGDGDNIFTDTNGFADFAERLGVRGIADLLEAAAAYTACVEGRPHFSRPQLIRHVIAVAPEGEISRENGLRGFGTLLRSGKIQKIKRGQFVLTEGSRYITEARKLAR